MSSLTVSSSIVTGSVILALDWEMCRTNLICVEAVVYEDADVVQVQSLHVFDSLCRLLESRQPHVKVDLIQVAAVERIQLERFKHLDQLQYSSAHNNG